MLGLGWGHGLRCMLGLRAIVRDPKRWLRPLRSAHEGGLKLQRLKVGDRVSRAGGAARGPLGKGAAIQKAHALQGIPDSCADLRGRGLKKQVGLEGLKRERGFGGMDGRTDG